MNEDLCIHELDRAYCAICKGSVHGADPKAVAGGLKAAASRAGRVALPPKRFAEEIDAAIAQLRASREAISVSAVQRILRAAGYESGRKPTTAALRERGLLD